MANEKTPEQVARQLEIDAAKFGERVQVAFLKRARGAMIQDVKDNFNTLSSPDGAPWAPLQFPRPNSKGGDRPLNNNGLLRASITGTGAGHIENLTATSVEIGTAAKQANLMHAGGTVVPTKAKALAIPLTKEAYSATVNGGGPRKFPRPLFVLWKAGAKSGVLAEVNHVKVSTREKSLRTQTAKLTGKQAGIAKQIKALAKQAKHKGLSDRKKAALHGKINVLNVKLRGIQGATAKKTATREQLASKRGGVVAHFALVKSVTVPARPFVGFGQRLVAKLESAFQAVVSEIFKESK